MTRKFSLWDEMCEDILSANTEQMPWLMNQVGFKSALNCIPPEDLTHMADAKFDMVLPYLNIGPDLLAEAAHWLSNNDPRYQNAAQKLIKKHAEQESSSVQPSSVEATVSKVRNAVLKYNQNPSDTVMKRFAQAYEDQHNIQQGKRIAAELAQTEEPHPTKTRRKL